MEEYQWKCALFCCIKRIRKQKLSNLKLPSYFSPL
jgi:hypothetical protein